jgi:hypothetical protein
MINNNKNDINPFKKKFRIVLTVVFLLLFLAYLFILLSPTGTFKFKRDFKDNIFSSRGFITDIRPGIRFDLETKNSLIIIAEPVYFSIFSPRNFDNVKLNIKYRNNLSNKTPIVELGILKDKTSNSYQLKPIENKIIDNNFSNWDKVIGDNVSLFQKNKNYSNIEDFFNDLENNNLKDCDNINKCLITYNYLNELKINFNEKDIGNLVIDQDFRGSHSFYIYFPENKNELKIN